jgi:hypothetical protein
MAEWVEDRMEEGGKKRGGEGREEKGNGMGNRGEGTWKRDV